MLRLDSPRLALRVMPQLAAGTLASDRARAALAIASIKTLERLGFDRDGECDAELRWVDAGVRHLRKAGTLPQT